MTGGVNPGRDLLQNTLISVKFVKAKSHQMGKESLNFARGSKSVTFSNSAHATRCGEQMSDENGRAVPTIMGCYGIVRQPSSSAVMEQHTASLSIRLQKGKVVTLGELTSKRITPFDVRTLIPVNVKDEAIA